MEYSVYRVSHDGEPEPWEIQQWLLYLEHQSRGWVVPEITAPNWQDERHISDYLDFHDPASIRTQPWHVSIQIENGHTCDGTIVNNRWVLTTQDCASEVEGRIDNTRVRAGIYNVRADDAEGQVAQAKQIVTHPNFGDPSGYPPSNDAALIEVSPAFDLSDDHVASIKFAGQAEETAGLTKEGQEGTITAWYAQDIPTIFRGSVNIISNETAATQFGDPRYRRTSLLFAKQEGDCVLGEGGALVVKDGTGNPVMIGINQVSSGCSEGSEGSPDEPLVYTRVSSVEPWMKETIGSDSNTGPIIPGTIASYRLNGAATDRSAGHDGLVEGPRPTLGRDGLAYAFNGESDKIALPLKFDQVGSLPTMTSCAWFQVRSSTTTHDQALVDFDGSEYFSLYVEGKTGVVGFDTQAGTSHDRLLGTTAVNDGRWHHACALYDGKDKSLYVDGHSDGQSENGHAGLSLGTGVVRYGFIGTGSEATEFNGATHQDRSFIGVIDDIGLYDRALSGAEIQTLRTAIGAPAAYYALDIDFKDRAGIADGEARGTKFVDGPVGRGVYFDGNDYVALSKLNLNGKNIIPSMTACSWVHTAVVGAETAYDNYAIIDFDGSEYFSLFVGGEDGKVIFSTSQVHSVGPTHDLVGAAFVADDRWHYVCGVYDGNDKVLYVDGVEDARAADAHGGHALGSGNQRFGFIGDGSESDSFDGARNQAHFTGGIDEIRLYGRALSPEEIGVHYQQRTETPPGRACEAAKPIKSVTQRILGFLDSDYIGDHQPSCLRAEQTGYGAELVYRFEVTEHTAFRAKVQAIRETAVYLRKQDCASDREIVCSNERENANWGNTTVDAWLDPGVYFLFVDEYDFTQRLILDVFFTPLGPNTCAELQRIDANDQLLRGLLPAEQESLSQGSCGGSAAEHVYAFELLETTNFSAKALDPAMRIYLRKDDCGDTSEIACGLGSLDPSASALEQQLAPGTYFLFVDTEGNSAEEYTVDIDFNVAGKEEGTSCDEAISIETSNQLLSNIIEAGRDSVSGSFCSETGGPEHIYRFEVTDSPVQFTAEASNPRIGVYLQEDMCEEGRVSSLCPDGEPSFFSIRLETGVYFLIVDTPENETEAYDLDLRFEIIEIGQGSQCSEAIDVEVSQKTISGGIDPKAHSFSEGTCGGRGSEAVYGFELTRKSIVEVQVDEDHPDSDEFGVIHVRNEACRELACSDIIDDDGVRISERLDAGEYFVFMDLEEQSFNHPGVHEEFMPFDLAFSVKPILFDFEQPDSAWAAFGQGASFLTADPTRVFAGSGALKYSHSATGSTQHLGGVTYRFPEILNSSEFASIVFRATYGRHIPTNEPESAETALVIRDADGEFWSAPNQPMVTHAYRAYEVPMGGDWRFLQVKPTAGTTPNQQPDLDQVVAVTFRFLDDGTSPMTYFLDEVLLIYP